MKKLAIVFSFIGLISFNSTAQDLESDEIIEQHSQEIYSLGQAVIGLDETIQDNVENQAVVDGAQNDRINAVEQNKVDNSTYSADKNVQSSRDEGQDEKIESIDNSKVSKESYSSDKSIQASLDESQNKAITEESSTRQAEVKKVANQITSESAARQESVNGLNNSIDTIKSDNGKIVESITGTNSRVDGVTTVVSKNTQSVNSLNKQVENHSRQIDNHETRLNDLTKSTNENFSRLRNEVSDVKKESRAGIAGVAAMANIPQVLEHQKFSLGAGVGMRGNQQAIAVGFSARASEHVVTKMSVSTDTQHGFSAGAGFSYGW